MYIVYVSISLDVSVSHEMECCVVEYGSLGRVRDGQLDMSHYLYYLYPIDILFPEESVYPITYWT